MGLNHEFILVKKDNFELRKYKDCINFKKNLEIHDDLIGHMHDTLEWIPSIFLSGYKKKNDKGLMRYGVTVIESQNAYRFVDIIHAWMNLLSLAPTNTFQLSDGLMLEQDGLSVVEPRRFDMFDVEREHVLEILDQCDVIKTEMSEKDYVILHLGI